MKNSRRLIAFLLCFVLTISAVVVSASALVGNISGQTSKYYQPLYVGSVESGAIFTQTVIPGSSAYGITGAKDSVISSVEVPAGSSQITLEVINCGSYLYSQNYMGTEAVKYNKNHTGETVVAAMNGDPWIMYHKDYDGDGSSSTGSKVKHVSMSRGILIIDGELWATQYCDDENNLAYTSNAERGTSAANQVAFAVTNGNTYMIGSPQVTVSFANNSRNATYTAAGINRLPAPNSIIIYNQRTGTESQAYEDAYEIYVNMSDSAFGLGKTISGTVTGIYASGTTSRPAIDANTVIISARGSSIASIQNKFSAGETVSFSASVTSDPTGYTTNNLSVWNNVREAIGGFYEVVKEINGVATAVGETTSTTAYPCPIIGIKADGTAVMTTITSTVDGNRNATRMMYIGKIGVELGMQKAIMFDGGGSAQMVTLEGTTYVRRTSNSDGGTAPRTVTSGIAAVYHGADISATYSSSSSQVLLSETIEPSTTVTSSVYNMSYIEYINDIRTSGLTSYPGVPVTTTLSSTLSTDSLASPYTLKFKGWSIADGGVNGGIHYSLDGGATWAGTTAISSYSAAEQAVLDAASSLTNTTGVNGRFEVSVDLSAYAGQSVNLTLGVGTASGTFSKFLTIENLAVGTVSASTAGTPTYKYAYYSTVSGINGTACDLVGKRDPSYSSSWTTSQKEASILPAVGTGFTAPNKTISISGYAIVNGGVGNSGTIYWSVDKSNWTACTGTTIGNATSTQLSTAQTNGGVTTNTVTNTAFTNATADLSAYDGQTKTIYFATTTANADYIHFLTLEDVVIGSTETGDSGSSSAPTVDNTYDCNASIDTINGVTIGVGMGVSNGKHTPIEITLSEKFGLDKQSLAVYGWCVNSTGINQGINYSLDGGKTWTGTTGNYWDLEVNSPSDVGMSTGSLTYSRFNVSVDLSAYKGQTVTVTLGCNTGKTDSSGAVIMNVFAVISDVVVPTSSYNNATFTFNDINGDASTVRSGNTVATGVQSIPLNITLDSNKTFSLCGWAYVDGQSKWSGSMYASVDGGNNWIVFTGNYQNPSDRSDISNALKASYEGYGVTLRDTYTFAAFAGRISVDLSAYAGFAKDITIGIEQGNGEIRPLVVFQNVTIPGSHTHSYVYTSTGNGTHTVTCSNSLCDYSETVVCSGSGSYKSDSDNHWKLCDKCGGVVASSKGVHTGGTATCTTKAQCSACGVQYGSLADHTVVELEGKSATCTEDGLTPGSYCSVCNEIFEEQTTIEKTGHTEVEIPAIKATCTIEGFTAGVKCSDCNEILTAPTSLGYGSHNYVNGECTICGDTSCSHLNYDVIEGYEATCTEEGLTDGKKCRDCGEVFEEQQAIEKSPHTEQTISGKAATCTSTGLTDGVICSVCKTILVKQEVTNKIDHTEVVIKGKEATCYSDGYTDYIYCSVCKTVIQDKTTLTQTDHPADKIVTISGTPATCIDDGLTDGSICSVCNTVIVAQQKIVASGHSFTNYQYNEDATCGVDGTKTATCDNCNTTNTIKAEGTALSHNWVDATCTKNKTCSICKAEEANTALGHNPGEAKEEDRREPTCQNKGGYNSVVYCQTCGDKLSSNYVELGTASHSFAEYEYNGDAKCGVNGTKTAKCIYADNGCTETSTIEAEGTALEHAWSTDYKYDSENHWKYCTRTGCDATSGSEAHELSSGVCVCGYGCQHTNTIDVAEVPATCQKTGTTAGKKCSICGHITEGCEEIAKADHKWGEYVSDGNATCAKDGTKTAYCTYGCNEKNVIDDEGSHNNVAHTPSDAVKENEVGATCTAGGSYESVIKCSVCGHEISREKIDTDPLGHNADRSKYISDSTGHWYACSKCEDKIDFVGHTETAIGEEKSATCVSTGITAGVKCSVCEYVIEAQSTIDIDPDNHDLKHYNAQASTCTVKGWNAYDECVRAGCSYCTKVELDLADHVYTNYVYNNDAKCGVDGTESANCDFGCGEKDTRTKSGSALEHVYTNYKSNGDATCQKNGTETAVCDNGCGNKDTRTVENSKVDHNYVNGACEWCGKTAEIKVNSAIDSLNGMSLNQFSDWPITGDKPFTLKWTDHFGNGTASTNLKLKFWGIATGGQTLAYNVNGGAWVDFADAIASGAASGNICGRDDVVAAFANQGFVAENAGFDGYINLSSYSGNVSIGLAVKTIEGEYVQVVNITDYAIPRKFVGNIDYFNSNTVAATQGNSRDGIIVKDLGVLPGTNLWIGGWIMIDGGQQNRLAWSVNGGNTWNDILYTSNGAGQAHIDAANGAGLGDANWLYENATFNLQGTPIDLSDSKYAGQTITISIAGIATDGSPVVFAEITVTVPGTSGCTHSVPTWTSLGNGWHYGYCSVCSVKVEAQCTAGTGYGHDDTHHWTQCGVCGGVIVKTAHTGGNATCKDKATCEVCNNQYGELDTGNHTGSVVWTYTETTHTGKYSCCGEVTVENEAHTFTENTCDICGYERHDHNYINKVTDGALKSEANCTSPAVYYKSCSICGALNENDTFTDGDKDMSNHIGNLTWERSATTHKQTCDACNGIVVEGEHNYSSAADRICNTCGYEREIKYKYSGYIDYINGSGPNGLETGYGDLGKVNHKALWSTKLTTSLIDTTLSLRGWLVVDGGHDGFVYSVDGGNTWLAVGGNYRDGIVGGHDAVAKADGVETPLLTGVCFENMNIDLSAYKGQTLTVMIGFAKGEDRVHFATVTDVSVPGATWAGIIDNVIDNGNNIFFGASGSQVNGIINIFHNTALNSTTLGLQGWMFIDGGQTGISWSVDGGKTWNTNAEIIWTTPDDMTPYINTANGLCGTSASWVATDGAFKMNIDLSAYAGKTVTVTLARTIANNPTSSIIFAKINVIVPGTENHTCTAGEWTFNGKTNTHSTYCTVCGIEMREACTPSGAYSYDINGHWHACTKCNGIQHGTYVPHNINRNAPCTEGQKCTDCGYVEKEPTSCIPGDEATCTTDQVCTVCGTVIKEKLGHDLTIEVEGKAPTCSSEGWNAYQQCSRCDYNTKEVLGKTDHTRPDSYDCTKGMQCTVCKEYIIEPVQEHTLDLSAPACKDRECSVCGTVVKASEEHTPNIDNATCTQDKICTVCNTMLEEATGHHYITETILEPTCGVAGTSKTYCDKCGDVQSTDTIPATGEHTPDEDNPATCTTPQYCTVCLQIVQEALGHEEVKHEGQTATCYRIGWNEYVTCGRDGCTYSTYKEIPKLDHDTTFVSKVEATCGKAGHEAYEYCTNEGCDYTTDSEDKVIPPTGNHIYDNECYDTICNVCGYDRQTAPESHTELSPATCKTQAFCSVCQHYYGELDSENHEGKVVYVSIDGTYHKGVWNCCDKVEIESQEHSGQYGCDTTCTLCGGKRENLTHEWNTTYTDGKDSHWYGCQYCDAKKDEEAHVYSNVCADLDCDICGHLRDSDELQEHEVGTAATCIKKAICKNCNQEFGDFADHKPDRDSATCTQAKVCTVCGDVLENALQHKWAESYTTSDTHHWKKCERCDEIDGYEEHDYSNNSTCICGKACSHSNYTELDEIPNTCLTPGKTAGKQCNDCGVIFEGYEDVPAKNHKFENYVYNNDATCGADGTKTAQCENGCGASDTVKAEGTALEHDWKENARTDATCEIDGSVTSTCQNCQETKTETIEHTGHIAKDEWTVIIPADCTETGVSILECKNCGAEMDRRTDEALKHDMQFTQTIAPTCTEDGYDLYTCSRCEETEQRNKTDALNHTDPATGESAIITIPGEAATCTKPGKTDGKQCKLCGYWEEPQTEIPAGSHKWDDGEITTPATCTSTGIKHYKCMVEGCDGEKDEIIPLAEHELIWKQNATDHWKACKNCSYEEERIQHTWGDSESDNAGKCTVCEYSCQHSGGQATCEEQAVCTICQSKYGTALGHDWQTVKGFDATCEDDGLTDGIQCTRCQKWQEGHEQTVIGSKGHSYTKYESDNNATCEEDGTKTATCDNGCGTKDTVEDTGSALGHKPMAAVRENVVDATCENDGSYDNVIYCETCEKEISRTTETITALGHKASETWTVTKKATCTEDGEEVKYCVNCNTHVCETQKITKTGHSWGDDANIGWTVTIEATCSKVGEETRICDNAGCGHTETREISKIDHTKSDWIIDEEAKCETEGKKHIECTVCGEIIPIEGQEYTVIGVTGHKYSETSRTDASCLIDGEIIETCSNCGGTRTTTIPHPGHTEVEDKAVESTCTTPGKTAGSHCSVCEAIIIAQEETELKEHTESEWITDVKAQCESTGHRYKECTVCHKVLEEETLSAEGHKPTIDVPGKDPTCTETGLEAAKKCEVCGKLCTSEGATLSQQKEIPELGHDYTIKGETIAPSCTTEGYTIYNCSRCDSTLNKDYVDATGHEYESGICKWCGGLKDCNHEYDNDCDTECNLCGFKREPKHSYVFIDGKSATCTENGYKDAYQCEVCEKWFDVDESKTPIDGRPEIKADGHKYTFVTGQDATCTAVGYKDAYQCTVCEKWFDTDDGKTPLEGRPEIEVKGHDWETVNGYDATCTDSGLTSGEQCGVCKEWKVEQTVIPALNHPTKKELSAKAATCIDSGLEAATQCTLCNQIFNSEGKEVDAQPVVGALGHSEQSITVQPTCKNDGYVVTMCTRCYTETSERSVINATNHAGAEKLWITTKQPTCAESGSKYEICKSCGEKTGVVEEISKTENHNYSITVTKPATCTTDGSVTQICSVCKAEKIISTTPASHGETKDVITQAPTCKEKGLKDVICTVCGETVNKDVEIETIAHTETKVITAPTCTMDGYTTYTCTVCGNVRVGDKVDALQHVGGDWVIENQATCTKAGSKYQVCENCGEKIADSDTSIAELGHIYSEKITSATCTSEGSKIYTCTRCNDTYSESISKLDHVDGGWVIDKQATCAEAGSKHQVCKICQGQIGDSVEIEKLEHNYVTRETDSSCTVAGKIIKTCTVCGDVTETEKELASHVIGGWVIDTEATCEGEGTKHAVCVNCGAKMHENTKIDANGHEYNNVVIAPTCKSEGYTIHTCTVCNKSYTDNETTKLEHVIGGWVIDTEATCENAGAKHAVCKNCGETLYANTKIEATGHSYTISITAPTCKAQGYTTYTCTNKGCEHSYKDDYKETISHSDGGWVIDKDATCTEVGSKHKVCGMCGDVIDGSTTVIEKTNHTYTTTVVPPTCTTDGYTRRTCSVCEYCEEYDVVKATEHVSGGWIIDNAATCTMDGEKHEVCIKCGATINTEIIGKTNHTYTTTVVQSTCTTDGYTLTICTICGEFTKTDEVKAGHTFVTDKAVAPTCSASGLSEGQHCSVCGYVSVEQEIIAKSAHTYDNAFDAECNVCGELRDVTACNHVYDDCEDTTCNIEGCGHVRVAPGHISQLVPGKAATCTESGLTDGYVCAVCEKVLQEQETISEKSHNPSLKDGEGNACASCTQNSVCLDCGTVLDYARHGIHGTTEIIVASTCTTAGYKYTECNDCHQVIGTYTTLEKKEHREGDQWTVDAEATCGNVGSKHTSCTVCGAVVSIETIPATGEHKGGQATCKNQAICEVCGQYYGNKGSHVPGDEATCTTAQYCTVCLEVITEKLDHNYGDGVVISKPNCASEGETKYTCIDCGAEKIESIAKTGEHTPGEAANCTTAQICTICKTELEPATGHKGGSATCMSQAICDICKAPYGEYDTSKHSYDNDCDRFCNDCGTEREITHKEQIIPGKDATCTESGLTDGKICTVCNTVIVEQTIIPAKGHSFVGGICENCKIKQCTGHVFDNCEDTTCNNEGCDFVRVAPGHYYSSDCDATCNGCGETRVVNTEHKYDNKCDDTCNECGAKREVGDHYYEYECSETCKYCGAVREEHKEHKPVGGSCNSKATCEYCGIVCGDATGEHVYNGCNAYCENCGTKRDESEIQHSYTDKKNATYHWSECTVCGRTNNVEAHKFDNVCDTKCDDCGYERTVTHVYDNDCDDSCNVCNAKRNVTHVYSNACDATCNKCGAVRTVPAHKYDNACDTTCNVCGAVRGIEHVYDNACDTKCNICGNVRVVPAHVYDNGCDATCNECGAIREINHKRSEELTYGDYGHWYVCTECGRMLEYHGHVYDGCETKACACGYEREETGKHVYDNGCDATCNECGQVRTKLSHTYSYSCDKTCNVCGHERGESELTHTYAFMCSQICRDCGHVDESRTHKFTNNCDADCDYGCGFVRVPSEHVYEHDCSVTCAECGALRDLPEGAEHTFEFKCSETCSVCGYTRSNVQHTYRYSYDAESHWKACKICGKKESTETTPHNFRYTNLGDGTHKKSCRLCQYSEIEEHTFIDGVCQCKADEPVETMVYALPEMLGAKPITSKSDDKEDDK